ncbi:DNA repair protein rad57 [Anaeramoeba flamelloides]|uniref:DNA repair protein rad57 n=1 Tax=Anaeramoeba flamelloides TaxID=1746091 RepID=A0ABQ8YDE2_9EUKA|nr:DNA repair protein rad57 [Anaeramoeba flamelloides]
MSLNNLYTLLEESNTKKEILGEVSEKGPRTVYEFIQDHLSLKTKTRYRTLTSKDCEEMFETVSSYLVREPVKVSELQTEESCLSVGDRSLDELFGKGIPQNGGLIEIYGEAGCGKTNFCLQLLCQAQLPEIVGGFGGKPIYISSEGYGYMDRLLQLSEHYVEKYSDLFKKSEDLINEIAVESVSSIDQLLVTINKLIPNLESGDYKLIIIDSIASIMRVGIEQAISRAKTLLQIATKLKYISSTYNIPIILVNQVSAVIREEVNLNKSMYDSNDPFLLLPSYSDKSTPALGLVWSNCINTRICFKRLKRKVLDPFQNNQNTALRSMNVVFSSSMPLDQKYFIISNRGLVSYEFQKGFF